MIRYLIGRVLSGLAVVVALIVLTFFATHFIGDPLNLMLDRETSTEADRQALLAATGLDRPLWIQFVEYAGNLARGDFGRSLWQNRPAAIVVLERVPATLTLAGATLAFSVAMGVPIAMLAARQPGSRFDLAVTTITTAMGSMAPFWWALALILVVAVQLRWLPTSGSGTWQHLILPVLALAPAPIARITQILRASIVGELRQPYIATARAKGAGERQVLIGHVLRNAALPAITVLGAQVVGLLSSAVLVETIFAWPGVGQVALQAVQRRDLPVLIAAVFYTGVIVAVANILVDLAYAALDPRVRLT